MDIISPDPRNTRASIEIQLPSSLELERHTLVHQIMHALEVQLFIAILLPSRLRVEIVIVVSRDDNLLSMRLRGDPVDLCLYI